MQKSAMEFNVDYTDLTEKINEKGTTYSRFTTPQSRSVRD
jgi:hypothetical protein